ncbi:hypothetical protein RND81_05G259500 [Saponaria officinalis]|uniref:Uncharacterized protein n=1 Tax=Saponaria officinalis TaxID=3572 RepID=A0AAW1L2G0_SAPOF
MKGIVVGKVVLLLMFMLLISANFCVSARKTLFVSEEESMEKPTRMLRGVSLHDYDDPGANPGHNPGNRGGRGGWRRDNP